MVEWVIRDQLARSSMPGYAHGRGFIDQAIVDAWLMELRLWKIKSIICLLADEHLELYRDLSFYGGLVGYYRSQDFEVAHIPVLDYQNPPLSEEDIRRVGDAYERLPKPVLVHCAAGIDRTGQSIRFLLKRFHDGVEAKKD
jgi:hypothetical protein